MKIKSYFGGSVVEIEPTIFSDDRGFFLESYNKKSFQAVTGASVQFVQDNHSKSQKDVFRGIHFQQYPYSQGKLIRVVRGSIRDLVVDLRVESETFGTYQFFNLTDRNFKQVWVPKGFGHGFLTMEDETEVCYKVDEYYEPAAEITIRYDDVDIGIDWPATCLRVSEKDSLGISLAQFKQQIMSV